MHSKDQLQGRAARTISMMVLWTSSHAPRVDGKISMPSCGTEPKHCCNPALARCSNLASRPCNPRATDAMKSTAPSSKSFGLHVLAIYFSGVLFRIPFRIPFQLSCYMVCKFFPTISFCTTCPNAHFKNIPLPCIIFQSPFQLV